jgi:hypothetical protein
MQFFLLLPFIIYAFCVKRKIGYLITSGILLFNIILTFIISFYFNAGVSTLSDGNISSNYLYFKPWTRIGAYIVGILFGMMYWEFKNGGGFGFRVYQLAKFSKVMRHTCFIIGLIIINLLIFLPAGEFHNLTTRSWTNLPCAIYNCISRPLMVTGIALVLMGSMTGKHSLIRFFLAGEFWGPWAKLTFMAYIIHLVIFYYFYSNV